VSTFCCPNNCVPSSPPISCEKSMAYPLLFSPPQQIHCMVKSLHAGFGTSSARFLNFASVQFPSWAARENPQSAPLTCSQWIRPNVSFFPLSTPPPVLFLHAILLLQVFAPSLPRSRPMAWIACILPLLWTRRVGPRPVRCGFFNILLHLFVLTAYCAQSGRSLAGYFCN